MSRAVALLIVVFLLLGSLPASAALPPPPYRLGGTWAVSDLCTGPTPGWVLLVSC